MDSTIIASLIGLAGLIGTGLVSALFASLLKRRLRRERASIEQQTVGVKQFEAFTKAMERRMEDRDHDVANLTGEVRETNRLLRIAIRHIDQWHAWSRSLIGPIPETPVLPDELAGLPIFWADKPHQTGDDTGV